VLDLSQISYQPHKSLYFIDPFTQNYIPYSTSSYKTSNTWVNPNNKPGNKAQPSAMFMKSNSKGNGNKSWIPNFGAIFQVTREP